MRSGNPFFLENRRCFSLEDQADVDGEGEPVFFVFQVGAEGYRFELITSDFSPDFRLGFLERDDLDLPRGKKLTDEVVGKMRPTSTREAWEYTVEKVAVNAVMAGARPEYFPVILALAASQASDWGTLNL